MSVRAIVLPTVLAAVACLLPAPAPPGAAGAKVSLVPPIFNADVAVDAQGNAVAVWTQSNGTYAVVQGAVRPAGGAWQTPVNLSATSRSAGGANVAVDPQGNAVAVWSFNGVVQSAVRTAGEAWQAPVDLFPADRRARGANVAVDAQGNAVAVWQSSPSPPNSVVQSAVRPAGGAWQAPVDLTAADLQAFGANVAVDAQGNAVAVWQSSRYGTYSTVVQGAVRPAGEAWQAPVDLTAAGPSASGANVAVDPQGNAVAVWDRAVDPRRNADAVSQRSAPPSDRVVQGAVRPAGGAWQAPVDLSAASQSTRDAQVAVGAQGDAVAVWSNGLVQSAVRPAGGAWQAPVDVSAAGASGAQVGVGAQGNAVAVWEVQPSLPPNSVVQGAGRPAGGAWEAPAELTASGPHNTVGAQVAVDPQGNAVAVWGRFNRTEWIVQSAVRPAGGAWEAPVDLSGPPLPRPPTDPPKPAVARLRLSPSTVRTARPDPTVSATAVQSGTRVSYTLNLAAKVRFTVQRSTRGRRVGARCVKQTTSTRRRNSCTRSKTVRGSFTRTRPAGADRFTFAARLAGRALEPGRYRLVATATANGLTGTPARARFRIVP